MGVGVDQIVILDCAYVSMPDVAEALLHIERSFASRCGQGQVSRRCSAQVHYVCTLLACSASFLQFMYTVNAFTCFSTNLVVNGRVASPALHMFAWQRTRACMCACVRFVHICKWYAHVYIHIYVYIYAYVPKGLLLIHSLNHLGPSHFLELLAADVAIVLLSLICIFILLFQNSANHVTCMHDYVYVFTARYLSVYASIFISLCITDFVTPLYFIRGLRHQIQHTRFLQRNTPQPHSHEHTHICMYWCMYVCVHVCICVDVWIGTSKILHRRKRTLPSHLTSYS